MIHKCNASEVLVNTLLTLLHGGGLYGEIHENVIRMVFAVDSDTWYVLASVFIDSTDFLQVTVHRSCTDIGGLVVT